MNRIRLYRIKTANEIRFFRQIKVS